MMHHHHRRKMLTSHHTRMVHRTRTMAHHTRLMAGHTTSMFQQVVVQLKRSNHWHVDGDLQTLSRKSALHRLLRVAAQLRVPPFVTSRRQDGLRKWSPTAHQSRVAVAQTFAPAHSQASSIVSVCWCQSLLQSLRHYPPLSAEGPGLAVEPLLQPPHTYHFRCRPEIRCHFEPHYHWKHYRRQMRQKPLRSPCLLSQSQTHQSRSQMLQSHIQRRQYCLSTPRWAGSTLCMGRTHWQRAHTVSD